MASLAALAACLGAGPAMAQTVVARPAADSAARADSARAADTARTGGTAGDTARVADTAGLADTMGVADTVGRSDTTNMPGGMAGEDTARAAGAPGPAAQAAPAPPPAPVDSALAAACEVTGGDPPDLLTVRFRASATESERAAVAKAVGGTLVARSEHLEPGAWFLHVPNSAIDPSIADRVIRLSPVLQVGATRCPS
jgi:hypothetical protein